MGEKIAAALMVFLAVGLAGCGDHTSARRPAPRSTPGPAGAVNPDAGVTTYLCLDGQTITAGYPDRDTAVVTYKGHAYILKLVRSPRGERYTGYGLQWWTQDGQAAIAALKPGEEIASEPGLACDARGRPDVEPITRASAAGAQVFIAPSTAAGLIGRSRTRAPTAM